MQPHYEEILAALGTPLWWTEDGVPRYVKFSPKHAGNLYADEVALMTIACQACDERFQVCVSSTPMDAVIEDRHTIRDRIALTLAPVTVTTPRGTTYDEPMFAYGDPPNTWCCRIGPTMTAVPQRLDEVWIRDRDAGWVRHPELEIEIPRLELRPPEGLMDELARRIRENASSHTS